ncbi:alpha-(1,3)-fucosyltransferase C-like [Anoplophora glabripennis]|uniref:alpha-(1,3)-fucosyltransferase C-like n=1 Tax=Anoplophora glabripennis TaxID=217634 RepID=UPI000873CE0D|nr:alpha-(1,3)-fucosyltransferase C-like [Anoplophora glabripennis]
MYINNFKCVINDIKRTPDNVPYKNILYWNGAFGHADFYLGFGSKIFERCEVRNCFTTDNRCYLPIDQFDAVLFHGREYIWETQDKPENRSQAQVYIYVNQESPANTPKWIGSDNFFNWTMTYRLDSDIAYTYGMYKNITTNYKMPTVEEVQQKSRKIAWMVSNCNPPSNRKTLYEKLSKYFPIDVYGACGTMSCPREDSNGCYDLIARNYKFYLSFENSICVDYVTEKMYSALNRDFIPIVYGGANYSKFAPPNSVIDVSKFSSIEELAKYLKSLDEDPKKYLSYFEWKKHYIVKRDHKTALCDICKKLNEPLLHKSYDIQKWWSDGMCKVGDDLPKIVFT